MPSSDTADNQPNSGLSLTDLAKAAESGAKRGLPPVHLWNPPYCGMLDMRIAADGLWYYNGTPIGRERLVQLFSTILRRDGDDYFLVTPVEKVGITVDDAPFTAVAMAVEAPKTDRQVIAFKTNVGDVLTVDDAHRFRFAAGDAAGAVVPYVHVRAGLEAKIVRSVFYDLVEIAVDHVVDGTSQFGVWSSGLFFPMVPSHVLDDATDIAAQ